MSSDPNSIDPETGEPAAYVRPVGPPPPKKREPEPNIGRDLTKAEKMAKARRGGWEEPKIVPFDGSWRDEIIARARERAEANRHKPIVVSGFVGDPDSPFAD